MPGVKFGQQGESSDNIKLTEFPYAFYEMSFLCYIFKFFLYLYHDWKGMKKRIADG